MARADRRRVRSARPDAELRTYRRTGDAAIEDTMFFPKLRRHAKWMFVFLALTFGVGFVVFGIGASGQGASLGDLLCGSGGTDNDSISVSDAREKVEESPKSAAAQRELATALQQEGEQDEAIIVLNRYLELRPKDEEALRELASLYLNRATKLQQTAQE